MADLSQVGVPYPVLLAEYQERVSALTNENIMLRATVTQLQATAQQVAPLPASVLPQGLPVEQPAAAAPPGEPEG
jgi:hypothetical protein